jgi:hypothetical protein
VTESPFRTSQLSFCKKQVDDWTFPSLLLGNRHVIQFGFRLCVDEEWFREYLACISRGSCSAGSPVTRPFFIPSLVALGREQTANEICGYNSAAVLVEACRYP